MLRSLAFVLVLLSVVPIAEAAPEETRPATATIHYRGLEKLLRKFSRQAGEASRGKIYAQR